LFCFKKIFLQYLKFRVKIKFLFFELEYKTITMAPVVSGFRCDMILKIDPKY